MLPGLTGAEEDGARNLIPSSIYGLQYVSWAHDEMGGVNYLESTRLRDFRAESVSATLAAETASLRPSSM